MHVYASASVLWVVAAITLHIMKHCLTSPFGIRLQQL